jgi:hypothetical protein
VPVGLVGIALAYAYFDNFRDTALSRFDFKGFVLCGVGLAAVQLALEFAGRQRVSNFAEEGFIAVAFLCLGAYGFYARRVHDPVIDLNLFRLKSFRIANLAGTICRIGFSSTSFLLPLLLQIPFGLSAFKSGLITSVLAIGAIAMRTMTPRVLRRFGFRTILLANGAIVSAMMMGLALITEGTSHWALAGFLLVLGFFRSLMYTALGNLGYADLIGARIGPGSSLGSVMQQLSASLGVAVSATMLGFFVGPDGALVARDFPPVFLIMTLFPLASLFWFARLDPTDGAHVSGHRARS